MLNSLAVFLWMRASPSNGVLLLSLFGKSARVCVCVYTHTLGVYSSPQSCVGRECSALAPLADAAQPSRRKSEGEKKKEKL